MPWNGSNFKFENFLNFLWNILQDYQAYKYGKIYDDSYCFC